MLIPSIDIMGGRAVQLVGGERFELDCGDPLELAARFSVLGELAVVDLDAALGKGSNLDQVAEIASRYPSRVGGGVRDERIMTRLLDAGARSVMVGTMATPAFLSAFPKDRLVAALDNKKGIVMAEGWKTSTGESVAARAAELAPHVGGFLVTTIDIEGSLSGIDVGASKRMIEAIRKAGFGGTITVAGGITSASEVAALDAMGADAQVGIALYKGILDPAEALAACLNTDRADGLWPTVVCDETGVALGLVYSNLESLHAAIAERAGVYHSRKRGLWRKGESSGNSQVLLSIDADCDRDALRFTVRQNGGGFCHRGTRTCFGATGPDGFGSDMRGFQLLSATTARRLAELSSGSAPKGSYTARLFSEPGLLGAKLAEEAADLLYFTSVKLAREGASLYDVERILDGRAMRVTRRPGNVKLPYAEKGNEPWKTGIH
jgi:phosphoribosylformimino-5-aminoimidazole carboxamide ribonucleotide (ProFAR) isomerase/phosphoribosyl-ATP pyrophosphohydrolase